MAKGLSKAREIAERSMKREATPRPTRDEWFFCMYGGKELCSPISGEGITSERIGQVQKNCHTCQNFLSKRERQGENRGENLPCVLLRERLLNKTKK